MRLIFDAEICEALELLLATLSKEQGFQEVVDCITAWQDLVDSGDSALRPLLECLEESDAVVLQRAVAVVNALIRHAPDEAQAFRIKNELSELDYKSHLDHLRAGADSKVLSEIEQFQELLREEAQEDSSCSVSQVKESAVVAMLPSDPLSSLLAELQALLLDESTRRGRILVVERVVEVLREIRTLEEAEAAAGTLRVDAPRERSIEAAKSGRPSVSLVATTRQPPPLALPSPYKLPGRHDAPSSPLAKSALPPPPAPPPPPPLQVVKAPPTTLSLHGKGPPAIPPPPGLEPRQIQVKLPESMKPKRAPSEALKMKTIMWTKIAPTSIVNGQGLASVWGELARQSTELSLDFDMIDGMFAVSTSPAPSTHMDSSPAQSSRKKCLLVDLLTPKRSQNVTITLKQFEDLDALLSDLRENKVGRFEVEKLRTLRTILPDAEEVSALRRYTGEVSQLAPACSFFLRLLDIPDYRLRIECMVFRLEFHRIMEEVVPGIHLLKTAATELRQSRALRRLLLLLVNIGNYLNSSSAHGNAAGFKLSSLWKVIDHKATNGASSLLHLLAKMEPDLLPQLELQLPTNSGASEISVEEIRTSLRALGEQCTALSSQLKAMKSREFEEIREYLTEHCDIELSETNKSLGELLQIQEELALFFCENKSSFKIEECLKIFKILIVRLRQAHQENVEREERCSRKQRASFAPGKKESSADGEPNENRFLATLETGQKHYSRKRISARVSNTAREREIERSTRPSPARSHPTDSPELERRSETCIPTASAAHCLPPTSAFHVTDLKDYVEILEKQISPHIRRSVAVTKRVSPARGHQDIALSIPSESDASTSARSSPKSSSDEGFDSEKDKDNSISRKISATTPSNATLSTDKKAPAVAELIYEDATTPQKLPSPVQAPVPLKGMRSSTIILNEASSPKGNSIASRCSPPVIAVLDSCPNPCDKPFSLQAPSNPPRREPATPKTAGRFSAPSESKQVSASRSPAPVTQLRPPMEISKVKKVTGIMNNVPTTYASRKPLVSQATIPPRRKTSTPPQSISREAAATQQSRRPRQAVVKRAITTDEGREAASNQVSTSSRPRLIKTGSVPQSSNLPRMDVVEKPRPLRKASDSTRPMGHPSTRVAPRPKWV